jgi:hypothetical protein
MYQMVKEEAGSYERLKDQFWFGTSGWNSWQRLIVDEDDSCLMFFKLMFSYFNA